MRIHIIHDRTTYVGKVVCNFNQIANAVLVIFDKPIHNNKKDIFLKFDHVLKTWSDEEGISKQDPLLFGQILNKIDRFIKESDRMTKGIY
jgi:hypothetical protein